MKICLNLFLGFLRVGCFSFGGAYGAIPLIRDVVLSYGWLDEETLAYMIAVSESTPGPIMVNLATYIGSSQAGLPGAILATLAVVLPSFLVVLLVMAAVKSLLDNSCMQAVLKGIKPCVIGIILATGVFMILHNCLPAVPDLSPDIPAAGITLVLLTVSFGIKKLTGKKISPIKLILIAACLGVAVYGV